MTNETHDHNETVNQSNYATVTVIDHRNDDDVKEYGPFSTEHANALAMRMYLIGGCTVRVDGKDFCND